MKTKICPCGSLQLFENCCSPYINGFKKAPTALALMKSRYAAYATHQADYLIATTHVSERENYSKEAILHWAITNNWQKLEILNYSETEVAFKAYFLDENNIAQIHNELSTFKKEMEVGFM
jgi:SEC-C motif-containing protein